MMEPVSLAIGAIPLASLFKTCVEAFDYIQSSNSFGRDLQLLQVKLDVEKTRLLVWGNEMGLHDGNLHSIRFRLPQVQRTVHNILNCIYLLLTDAEELAGRYGLEPCYEKRNGMHAAALSKNRMTAFVSAYSAFKAKAGLAQEQTPIGSKVQWAIHDHSKFKELVEDLKGFVDALKDITDTPESCQHQIEMEQEDVESIRGDVASLKLLIEACADDHLEIVEAASLCLEQVPRKQAEERLNIHNWIEGVSPRVVLSRPSNFRVRHVSHPGKPRSGSTNPVFLVCKDYNFHDETTCLRPSDIEAIARGGYGSLFGSRSLGRSLAEAIEDLGPPLAKPPDGSARIYIYCPPSRHLLELALSMCGNTGPFKVVIRPDDRLCTESHSHHFAMQSVLSLENNSLEGVNGFHNIRAFEHSWVAAHLDIPWIRERSRLLGMKKGDTELDIEQGSDSGSSYNTCRRSVETKGPEGLLLSELNADDQAKLRQNLDGFVESYRNGSVIIGRDETTSHHFPIVEKRQETDNLTTMDPEHSGSELRLLWQNPIVLNWLKTFPLSELDTKTLEDAYWGILRRADGARKSQEALRALSDTSHILEPCASLLQQFGNKELKRHFIEVYVSTLEVVQGIIHGQRYESFESSSVFEDYSRQLSSTVSMISRAARRLERRVATLNSGHSSKPQAANSTTRSTSRTVGSGLLLPNTELAVSSIEAYLDLHSSDPTCAGLIIMGSTARCLQFMDQQNSPLVRGVVNPRDRYVFRLDPVETLDPGSDIVASDDRTRDRTHTSVLKATLFGKVKLNATIPLPLDPEPGEPVTK